LKKKRKLFLKLAAIAFILCIYPLCVLIYTWTCVFQSNLEGGRGGPLDAYRHTLASAVVSYTVGEWGVDATTFLMESRGKDSNKMDRHNNKIGAKIGSHAKSFKDLESKVHKRVLAGTTHSKNTNQSTWLAKERWRDGKIW
jgi:hypothetical protein